MSDRTVTHLPAEDLAAMESDDGQEVPPELAPRVKELRKKFLASDICAHLSVASARPEFVEALRQSPPGKPLSER